MDKEERYEVCKVEDALGSQDFNCSYHLQSLYTNPSYYEYDENNICAQLLNKEIFSSDEKIAKNLDLFKQECKKIDTRCVFIEGYYLSSNEKGYDCFYNRYNEDYDKIRLFWRTGGYDAEELYEVCQVDYLDDKGGKNFQCQSQWFTKNNGVYDESSKNKCQAVLNPYPTNEEQIKNKETIKKNCFKATDELMEGSCSYVEGLFVDSFKNGIDCFWNRYNENTEMVREFWRSNTDDSEERYEICSVKNRMDLVTQNYKCKSEWYSASGEDTYDRTSNNHCLQVEESFGDDLYKKKDLAKVQCKKVDDEITAGRCTWIEGVLYNKHQYAVDCFWNKYNEHPDLIRNFWRTNPQDEEDMSDEAFDVCLVEIFGNRPVTYKCHDIGSNKKKDDDGMSGGTIALIIILILVFVGGAGAVAFLYFNKKGPFSDQPSTNDTSSKNSRAMEMTMVGEEK